LIKNLSIKRKTIVIGILHGLISLAIVIPLLASFTDISTRSLVFLSVSLFVVVLVGETVYVWFIQKTFDSALNPVIDFSHSVAGGDLTRHLDWGSKDIVGKLVGAENEMVDGLRVILEKLREASTLVSATAEELGGVIRGGHGLGGGGLQHRSSRSPRAPSRRPALSRRPPRS